MLGWVGFDIILNSVMIIDMFTDLSWAQHSPNLLLFIFIRYADFQYCEYLVQNCEEWVSAAVTGPTQTLV